MYKHMKDNVLQNGVSFWFSESDLDTKREVEDECKYLGPEVR
jgi:hypothetical protein